MTNLLDSILKWAALKLPETKVSWIEDLRHEANHVPSGFRRFQFLSSGIFAALGELLRINIGPRRVGQGLLGFALLSLCLYLCVFVASIEDDNVKMTFYCALPLYGVASGLALFNLGLMKRYTIFCSLIFTAIRLALGFEPFVSMDAPMDWMRAFTLEASVMMAGLFIAASYLAWIEETRHA